eukprot:173956_1
MAFVSNLPNNGARYAKKKSSTNNVYFHPYIAWHNTNPPDDYYCEVNPMNHLERSVLLRQKMEKLEREKNQLQRHKIHKKTKRMNRKRKRPMNENNNNNKRNTDENVNGILPMKRRKRARTSSHKPPMHHSQLQKENSPKSEDVMDFLMAEVLENDRNHNNSRIEAEHRNLSLFDSLNNLPKLNDNVLDAALQGTVDNVLNEI